MTSYNVICERFLSKITDYDIVNIEESDFNEMLHGWMISAITKYRKCPINLSKRNDDLQCFSEDLSDIQIEIVACLMVAEWLDPQVNSILLTKQFFGGKEEKFFAQSNQLETIKALRDDARTEARKLMRDESYGNNGYFG